MQETLLGCRSGDAFALSVWSGFRKSDRNVRWVLTVWWFLEILILWTVDEGRWWELRWAVYCSDFCDWSEFNWGLNNREFMIVVQTKLTLSYGAAICIDIYFLLSSDRSPNSRSTTLGPTSVQSRRKMEPITLKLLCPSQVIGPSPAEELSRFLGSPQAHCFSFRLHRVVISRQCRLYRK